MVKDWVVHIIGPDVLIEQPDEITALRFANEHNKAIAKIDRQENDPLIMAIVYHEDEPFRS